MQQRDAGGAPATARSWRGARLGRSALLTAALRSFQLGAEFLAGLLLARLLGAAGFGAFAFATAWAGLLGTPATLGFDRLLIRETARCRGVDGAALLRGLLQQAGHAALLASLALIGGGLLLYWSTFTALDAQSRFAFLAALPLIPLLAIARLRQAVLQGLQRIGAGQLPEAFVQPAAMLALIGVLAALPRSWHHATAAVAMQVLAATLACAVGILLLQRALPVDVRRAAPRIEAGWQRAARPFLWIVGVNVALAHVDLILVGLLLGAAEAGVYRGAQQLALFAGYPLLALNVGLAPLIARLHAGGRRGALQVQVNFAARLTLAVGLPIAIVLLAFATTLLGLFGPGFEAGAAALMLLTLGQLANAATGPAGTLLIMTNHEATAARLFGAGAAIHLVGNLLLIPRFGIAGAAAATAFALLAMNLLLVFAARRRLGIDTTAFGRHAGTTRA
jgi:O-antigen/teichoic acid export membrane protein